VTAEALDEASVREALDAYLSMLQTHPTADEMIGVVLTADFETGFAGGHLWEGREGLADFLSQREGFFDERHELKEIIDWRQTSDAEAEAKTRLEFFLRSWKPPAPKSSEYTGDALHSWRLRREEDRWLVAAQIVDGFEDLNDNAQTLFATPDSGLNR
jgi:SnoaL-like domain